MNRRSFLQSTTAAATALAASSIVDGADAGADRIVDTHTHFYDTTRAEGVPWPEEGTPLYRRVLPADWLAVASPHGVRETVVVEASEWLPDNQWILDLAASEKSIIGFIGHLFPHEDGFAGDLERLGANPIFRGIRVSGDDFLDHAGEAKFRASVALLAERDLVLELNGPVEIHPLAAKFAADFPSIRIVIDHVGGAGDAASLSAEWRDGMKALARHSNVYCKVSALTEQTDASNAKWGDAPRDTGYYAPILDHCWETFGEDRLVYGSNWPVCEKGGTYADQFRIVNEYFSSKGREARQKYFWKNARRAYRWPG